MTEAVLSSVTVQPSSRFGGNIAVPGDKSISHRIALLGALGQGETRATGFLDSEDSRNILAALNGLGVEWSLQGNTLALQGCGSALKEPHAALNMGNSGTGMRLMAGILAGQTFTSTMIGDASLSSRPMRRIQEPLVKMGAAVDLLGADGRPPVRITGGKLEGISYTLPVASAQVKSCVLLAGLFARGETTVIEKRLTRDHTERLLHAMGVPVRVEGMTIIVKGYDRERFALPARSWVVPGDFSSAAFWITAAACAPDRDICIEGVGLNPRRTALLNVLRRMGAKISVIPYTNRDACEILGTVMVRGVNLSGTEVDEVEVPDLIDELPLVAVAGALATGKTVIRGAAELRVKESDRIAAMTDGLAKMGVRVSAMPDGMEIEGGARIRGGATIESFGDHRIPMALAVAALVADRPVHFRDVGCVAKSYPAYWNDLEQLGGKVEHHRCH